MAARAAWCWAALRYLPAWSQARLDPAIPLRHESPAFSFPSSSPRFAAIAAQAGEWPRFRGPNGSGLADGEVPAQWEAVEPFVEGRAAGFRARFADRAGAGGVFVLCGDEATGRRTAVCLSTKDGAILWKHDAPGEAYRHHRFNSVASSTPGRGRRARLFFVGLAARNSPWPRFTTTAAQSGRPISGR